MVENFDNKRQRYASKGITDCLPEELINRLWSIIDLDIKGMIPLMDILYFDLIDNGGFVTVHFSQEISAIHLAVDLPFLYSDTYPSKVFAFDDGKKEMILLPVEIVT